MAEATSDLKVGLEQVDTATFTAGDIAAFARLAGDTNTLHHDAAAAAASRFGGVIASGAHTGSVLMGRAADFLSRYCANVGLGYQVKLRRPVRAGASVRIEWRVAAIEHNARLGGDVVTMEGRMIGSDGAVAVTGSCQALVLEKDAPPA